MPLSRVECVGKTIDRNGLLFRQQVKCNGCGELVNFRFIYKRATLSVLGSKRHALHAVFFLFCFCFFSFEIGKPYELEQNVESIFFTKSMLFTKAFKKFLFKATGADLAQVAAYFQVCLHCSPLSSLCTAVAFNFRS